MSDSLPSCCKNLWVLLSGSTILKSKEYIGHSLEKNMTKVTEGVLYYKPREKTTDLKKELDSIKKLTSDIPSEFLQKLSLRLDITFNQAYDLFVTFLVHEFSGSSKSIQTCFSCEKNAQQLLRDLELFYFEERLFALFCLKEILCNINQDQSQHPYKRIFADYVQSILLGNKHKIIESIIDQLKCLLNKHPTLEPGLILDEDEAQRLRHFSRERFELTQILMLAAQEVLPKSNHILELMKLFSEFNYRSSFPGFRSMFDEETDEMVQMIPVIESLFLVQCLKVDILYKYIESDEVDTSCLQLYFENPDDLRQLDKLIRDKSSSLSNCIVFLGWILVRSWELEPLNSEESTTVVKKLGSIAIDRDVFGFLTNFLESDGFHGYLSETKVGSVIKETIAGVLNVLFTLYRMEEMVKTRIPSVFLLLNQLLKDGNVASEVFSGDPDSGLLSIINNCLNNISRDQQTFLSLAISIASTPSFATLVDYIKEIDSFVETLPNSSTIITLNADGMTYNSKVDRRIRVSPLSHIIVKKGTTGRVLKYNTEKGTVELEWTGITVNGWTILADYYTHKIESVAAGSYSLSGDPLDGLEELTQINELCATLLSSALESSTKIIPREIRDLLRLSGEGLQLFTRFSRLPRSYIASVLRLLSSLAALSRKEAIVIWKMIQEVTLLPVLLGSGKDADALLSGHEISSSSIGSAIISEECPTSCFDLCTAYLDFISTMMELVPMDDAMIASLVFIMKEIFPVHSLWQIKRKQDVKIGFLCYSIAHKAISVINRTTPSGQVITKFVRTTLFSNVAGDTLLNTVKRGRDIVFKIIFLTGVDTSLIHHDTFTVRLALAILNQLLQFKEFEKKNRLTESKATAVERALFDWTSSTSTSSSMSSNMYQPDNRNMLTVLCNFIFQPYDFRLVVQGGKVLKRLAKSYPMSMLACLGSAAEAVKEHFLLRLESVTEDIRVKESLLDFLSVCVQHQPGLIELFINIESRSALPEDECNSILQTVLDILVEKKEGKYFCPEELHVACLRFLSMFWIQSNYLTIDCLKKCPMLWDLVSFPLFPLQEPSEEQAVQMRNKLHSHIFKLLARELFMTQVKKQSQMDNSLKEIVQELLSGRINEMSGRIRNYCSTSQLNGYDDPFGLVSSWRDVLVTLAYIPSGVFNITKQLKIDLYRDVTTSLLEQMIFKAPFDVLMTLTEASSVLLNQWSDDLVTPQTFEEWIKLSTRIVYQTNELKESLAFNLLINLEVMFTQFIRLSKKFAESTSSDSTFHLVNWMPAFSSLLLHSIRILESSYQSTPKSLTEESKACSPERRVQFRLVSLTLASFDSLMCVTQHHCLSWLPALKSVALIETLSQLLQTLIQSRRDAGLVSSLIALFISFSRLTPVAETIVTTSPTNLYWVSSAFKTEAIVGESDASSSSWDDVFLLTLRFVSSLLMERQQFFVHDTLALITQNLDRLLIPLNAFRTKPTLQSMMETKEILSLVLILSKYRLYWMSKFSLSFEVMLHETSKTCYTAVAYIKKPALFQYIIKNEGYTSWISSSPPDSSSHANMSLMSSQRSTLDIQKDMGGTPRKRVTFAADASTPGAAGSLAVETGLGTKSIAIESIDAVTESRLHHILCSCIHILSNGLPSVADSIEAKEKIGDNSLSLASSSYRLHLELDFVSPVFDQKKGSSFGSTLKAVEVYVSILSGKNPSGSETGRKLLPRNLVMSTLESAVSLIVSETCVAHIDPNITPEEKVGLRNKIKSDILYTLTPLRSLGKRRSSLTRSPPAKSSSTPSIVPDTSPLIKLLCEQVLEKILS